MEQSFDVSSPAELDVRLASGEIEIQAIEGATRVDVELIAHDEESQQLVDAARIELHDHHGRPQVIAEAWDNVSANTVSGDREHGAVLRGNVSAHSVSGDVHIGVRRGSKVFLDCNTVSGDTRSELELTTEAPSGDGPLVEIRAKTVSGDIAITRAPAPADNAQEVHA